VPHQRVRLWTVDAEIMKGWKAQIDPGGALANQERLWDWIEHNVDYRLRSVGA
jgi:hypothetical protein